MRNALARRRQISHERSANGLCACRFDGKQDPKDTLIRLSLCVLLKVYLIFRFRMDPGPVTTRSVDSLAPRSLSPFSR